MIFAVIPGRLAPKRRLSWQEADRLLVLIHAQMFSCFLILSRFFRLSTVWDRFLFCSHIRLKGTLSLRGKGGDVLLQNKLDLFRR